MSLKGIDHWRQLARYSMMGRLDKLFGRILDPRLGQMYNYFILYFIALYWDSGKV